MMNKDSIKRGLTRIICRGTDCRFCLLGHISCADISFDDIVSIARKEYVNLEKKYKEFSCTDKDEDAAMEFLKGAKME